MIYQGIESSNFIYSSSKFDAPRACATQFRPSRRRAAGRGRRATSVNFFAELGNLRFVDPRQPHRQHQIVDPPGGHAQHRDGLVDCTAAAVPR